MNSDNDNWVERLYQPKFDLDAFLSKTIRLQENIDQETQVNFGPVKLNSVNRAVQTDAYIWAQNDVEMLRRAYRRKFDEISSQPSPHFDAFLQETLTEAQELRENWRSTQQELDESQLQLQAERSRNDRLMVAIAGLKKYASHQLAEADDARWIAQFERKNAQKAFEEHLEEKKREQEQSSRLKKMELNRLSRINHHPPSLNDLSHVYRLLQEANQENTELHRQIDEANAALGEYKNSHELLLRHISQIQEH